MTTEDCGSAPVQVSGASIPIRFLAPWPDGSGGSYNPGESAQFSPDAAAMLIRSGYAEEIGAGENADA